jgi:hypothetical protein
MAIDEREHNPTSSKMISSIPPILPEAQIIDRDLGMSGEASIAKGCRYSKSEKDGLKGGKVTAVRRKEI